MREEERIKSGEARKKSLCMRKKQVKNLPPANAQHLVKLIAITIHFRFNNTCVYGLNVREKQTRNYES